MVWSRRFNKSTLVSSSIAVPVQSSPQRGHNYRVERCFHAVPGRVHSNLA